MDGGDDVGRAFFALNQRVSGVFPDNTQHEQLQSTHKKDGKKERMSVGSEVKKSHIKGESQNTTYGGDDGNNHPRIHPKTQRHNGKRDNAIGGFLDEGGEIEFRPPPAALGSGVGDEFLFESSPGEDSLHEDGVFVEGADGGDDFLIQQAKIPGVGLNGNMGNALHDGIKEPRRDSFEPAVGGTVGTNANDSLCPLLPFFHHVRDDVGGVLQIYVAGDDGIARGVMQSRHQRGFFAEIARQTHQTDGVFFLFLHAVFNEGGGGVGAAVIHKDELPTHGGETARYGRDALPERLYGIFFVVTGNDETDGLHGGSFMRAREDSNPQPPDP